MKLPPIGSLMFFKPFPEVKGKVVRYGTAGRPLEEWLVVVIRTEEGTERQCPPLSLEYVR
jgi:hypothetical protein